VIINESEEIAGALAQGLASLDSRLMLFLLNDRMAGVAGRHRIRVVPEAFVDLDYDGAGNLIIERVKTARDPAEVARRAVRLVLEHRLTNIEGHDMEVRTPTICLHGDAPNALDVISATRRALDAVGVAIRPVREILAHV
jgi:UPF0271 protein